MRGRQRDRSELERAKLAVGAAASAVDLTRHAIVSAAVAWRRAELARDAGAASAARYRLDHEVDRYEREDARLVAAKLALRDLEEDARTEGG